MWWGRDIKLDNIVLVKDVPGPKAKICDFGASKRIRAGWQLRSAAGTEFYFPPEVSAFKHLLETADERYNYDGNKADVWCCGLTLLLMLTACRCGTFHYHACY